MANDAPSRTLRIGTRASTLARWQAEHVANLLHESHPDLRPRIELFTTRGDTLIDAPLPEIGGKGLFTDELERALREHRVDLAVHSLKDLPTACADGLAIGAVALRADARDAVVSRGRLALIALPAGAVVGTSSLRRAAQLRRLRPDLRIQNIRGNVDTRVAKVQRGEYDALLLACAGLDRLSMQGVISERLPIDQMLPAPGQGALAVQSRDEPRMLSLLALINDRDTELCVSAERGMLAALGGGCALPVAAYATLREGTIHLQGRVIAADASAQVDVEVSGAAGDREAADHLGREAAEQAIQHGAAQLLELEATS